MSNVQFVVERNENNANVVRVLVLDEERIPVEQYRFMRYVTVSGREKKMQVRVLETTAPYYVFQPHDHEHAAKKAAREYFVRQS